MVVVGQNANPSKSTQLLMIPPPAASSLLKRCDCWAGWGGGDCSERMCPTGLAWSDEATATDTAHGVVECSNRGECDRVTGRCTCMNGFSGAACERNNCPRGCSGHGYCRSMSDYAEDYRGHESIRHIYNDVRYPYPTIFFCTYSAKW